MFAIQKINKRLHIVNGGRPVYSPPDFVRGRVRSRDDLQLVADAFNARGAYDVVAVMEFETKLRPGRPGDLSASL